MQTVSIKVLKAISLMKPYDINVPKRLVGSVRDGAYVLADNFAECDVLSIGVDHNDDFDLEMAEANHNIYMFDHTIDRPPHAHQKFHFHQIGVCGAGENACHLETIEQMLERCSLGSKIILKIDVEGAEWDVFSTIPSHVLARFDQILVEVHWLENLGDRIFRWKFCEALRRINSQFTLFHVHGNNNGEVVMIQGFPVVNVLELSYVRTSLVDPLPSSTVYPSYPNRTNNSGYHDLPLLFYPFLPTSSSQGEIEEMLSRIDQDFDSTN